MKNVLESQIKKLEELGGEERKIELLKQILKDVKKISLKDFPKPKEEFNEAYEIKLGKVNTELKKFILLFITYDREYILLSSDCLSSFMTGQCGQCKEVKGKRNLFAEILYKHLSEVYKDKKFDGIAVKKDWELVGVDREKMIRYERRQKMTKILEKMIHEFLFRAMPENKVEEFKGINEVIQESIDQVIETDNDQQLKQKLNEFFIEKSKEVLGDAKDAIESFNNILKSVDLLEELSAYNENPIIHVVEIGISIG